MRPFSESGSFYSILGLYRDNGKENGNYCSVLGLNWDHGKEDGNYYIGVVDIQGQARTVSARDAMLVCFRGCVGQPLNPKP